MGGLLSTGINEIDSVGYAMAKNLRAKIPATDTLVIRDVNEDATKRFVQETREAARSSGAGDDTTQVVVAQNAREVAEQSVSRLRAYRRSRRDLHSSSLGKESIGVKYHAYRFSYRQ